MIPACTVAASNGNADWKGDSSARPVFVPAVAGCQGCFRPVRLVHALMVGGTPAGRRRRRRHRLVERDFARLPVDDGRNGAQGHAVSESGCGAVVGVGALGRFERRGAYASRPTVFGFPRPVRRVGAPASAGRREACIVHGFRPVSLRDQQLAVRPVGCRHMAARRVRPVAGRALGRPARREGRPVPAERDRGSETAA